MYVCMYVCMYMYVCVCLYLLICLYTYVRMYVLYVCKVCIDRYRRSIITHYDLEVFELDGGAHGEHHESQHNTEHNLIGQLQRLDGWIPAP